MLKLLSFAPLIAGGLLLKPAFDVGEIWFDNARPPYEWYVVPRVGKPFDAKVHRQLDGTWEVRPAGRAAYFVKSIDDLDYLEIRTTPRTDAEVPELLRLTLPPALLVLIVGALQALVLRVAMSKHSSER